MNYNEIDKLVLENVMNWKYVDELHSWVEKRGEDTHRVATSKFSPSTNINHAYVIIDKLENEQLTVDIFAKGGKVSATLRCIKDHHFVAGWCSEEASLSISLAALVYKRINIPR